VRPLPTATIVVALVFAMASGCGDSGSPKTPARTPPPSSAVANCSGQECKVRVTCKGRVHHRLGAAPVRIRTSKTAVVTSIFIDFAGSGQDAVVRC